MGSEFWVKISVWQQGLMVCAFPPVNLELKTQHSKLFCKTPKTQNSTLPLANPKARGVEQQMQEVTSELLSKISACIVESIQPEKIVLFGSYAWGVPHRDSDVDLLVVVPSSDQPSYKRASAVYPIIVYTQSDEAGKSAVWVMQIWI
jgi:hypothetical protein